MIVRRALPTDLERLLDVHRDAFGSDEEARLTELLLADPTAAPMLSLVAVADEGLVGHVLLTAARVERGCSAPAAILAPLAVIPAAQGTGVGSALVAAALDEARSTDVPLVFVLGHPGYYPRFGFVPAMPLGLVPPHPIKSEHQDAWMVVELTPGALEGATGVVRVSEVLGRREYWVE